MAVIILLKIQKNSCWSPAVMVFCPQVEIPDIYCVLSLVLVELTQTVFDVFCI